MPMRAEKRDDDWLRLADGPQKPHSEAIRVCLPMPQERQNVTEGICDFPGTSRAQNIRRVLVQLRWDQSNYDCSHPPLLRAVASDPPRLGAILVGGRLRFRIAVGPRFRIAVGHGIGAIACRSEGQATKYILTVSRARILRRVRRIRHLCDGLMTLN
jgi:hypothetical protein